MSAPEQEQNPTMAEILSSIRHVIAKAESQNTGTDSTSSSQEEDILELTEPLEEPSSLEPSKDTFSAASSGASDSPESLLSKNSEYTASSAFQNLSRAVDIKQAQDEIQGTGGKTVDELVKEIMRPFIKDWLNQHLPLVVERLVSKEIDRLAAQARSNAAAAPASKIPSSPFSA